jgi:hypothetical protein
MPEPKAGDPYVMLMARLVTLESIVSGLLSMYLADPASEFPGQLFEKIRNDIESALDEAPLAIQQEVRVYRDALLHRASAEAAQISRLKPRSN